MAIQVSGSTVIHDSQDVQVSGMFTASSFVGDASQLTNLPASGGTLEATASGTLSDGSKVIVNADGTVSVVAMSETTGPGTSAPVTFNSGNTSYSSATYDSTNNKVVVAYSDYGNSYYGTAVVGTVSGNSISFGTPVVFNAAGTYHNSAVFDSSNNKVVIAFTDGANSNRGGAIVGTVSGTSISFGSKVEMNPAATQYITGVYDPNNQKVVFAYTDVGNSEYYGTAIVGTVSGTSISFGSDVAFESAVTYYSSIVYDSSNQKVVISYYDGGNGQYGTAVVGTVSGTSISFGTPVVFESAASSYFGSAYDSTNGKVVIAYRDNGNNGYGTAIVGTVSGTSISFGSAVAFVSSGVITPTVAYDSTNQKVVIAYRDSDNSSYGTLVTGTVSGTSISFSSPTVFESANSQYLASAYDSSNDKVVIAYTNAGNVTGSAVVFGNIGFPVSSVGSTTVFESDDTAWAQTAYDSTNGKVVIAYRDQGNSNKGTAIVGTVSGTSITFGTPEVFNSNSIQYPSVVHDPSSNKVVIAFSDGGQSWYGKAIVGTISGTDITFGSASIFRSATSNYISAVYDSNNSKIAIAYQDGGDSDRGKAVVAEVSGTNINIVGSNLFEASAVDYISTAYDSTNNRIIVAYTDKGNNNYGTAQVAWISGNSISFAGEIAFESSWTTSISVVYDSANDKVVITYTQDASGNGYGAAIVGQVSGNSISFPSSSVIFESAYSYYIAPTFDSTNNKVVIGYRDVGNSDYGTVVVGQVSGTSIVFGVPLIFNSGQSDYNSLAYDTANDKVVIAYRDYGNSSYGTATVFSNTTIASNLTTENFIGVSNGAYSNGQTATIQVTGSVDDAQSGLTAGQAYYVQDNGTLGESGSVFAGTAVAASKIIVKG